MMSYIKNNLRNIGIVATFMQKCAGTGGRVIGTPSTEARLKHALAIYPELWKYFKTFDEFLNENGFDDLTKDKSPEEKEAIFKEFNKEYNRRLETLLTTVSKISELDRNNTKLQFSNDEAGSTNPYKIDTTGIRENTWYRNGEYGNLPSGWRVTNRPLDVDKNNKPLTWAVIDANGNIMGKVFNNKTHDIRLSHLGIMALGLGDSTSGDEFGYNVHDQVYTNPNTGEHSMRKTPIYKANTDDLENVVLENLAPEGLPDWTYADQVNMNISGISDPKKRNAKIDSVFGNGRVKAFSPEFIAGLINRRDAIKSEIAKNGYTKNNLNIFKTYNPAIFAELEAIDQFLANKGGYSVGKDSLVIGSGGFTTKNLITKEIYDIRQSMIKAMKEDKSIKGINAEEFPEQFARLKVLENLLANVDSLDMRSKNIGLDLERSEEAIDPTDNTQNFNGDFGVLYDNGEIQYDPTYTVYDPTMAVFKHLQYSKNPKGVEPELTYFKPIGKPSDYLISNHNLMKDRRTLLEGLDDTIKSDHADELAYPLEKARADAEATASLDTSSLESKSELTTIPKIEFTKQELPDIK